MSYVDGFVLVVPTKNLVAYRKMAKLGGKVWREHGALDYVECVGDELEVPDGCGVPFTQLLKLKKDESVVFAWILYKSKADRNRVNKLVMSDPRMKPPKKMPFDIKRMTWGGLKTIVET
jgi:uncharacterized protein YbaA (DUF1428 family)